MTTQERIDKVNKIFNDEHCGFTAEPNGFDEVEITIDMGDWKHEHGYADYVMRTHGFVKCGEVITEDTDEDCYGSIHYYKVA